MTTISTIYARGPAVNPRRPDQRTHDARSAAWHDHGVAVIDPADVTDDWTRQAIINEAERLYGRRQADGQR